MQDVGGRETGLPGILLDTLFVFMLGVGIGRLLRTLVQIAPGSLLSTHPT